MDMSWGKYFLLTLLPLLIHAGMTSALWQYRVTWPEGEVTSYSYPRTSHGDCLYDRLRDRLICMRNHGYQSVVNTWLYDPELIVYVSVKCLAPHSYPRAQGHLSPGGPPFCVCKSQHHAFTTGSNPASSAATESFYRCQLEELLPSMLEELDQLEVLDLSHNLLQRFSPLTFHPLRALKVLSLDNNPLRRLPEGLVCPLTSLEVLNLNRMQLTTFPGRAFRCDGNDSVTSSVKWLDVSGNHISEMAAGSLWYLSHLRFLNLSDNLLHRLPPYPLLGAPVLSTLNMARNLLHEVPEFFCEGASGIRRLSLRSNMFASLSLVSLNTCQSLTHLDLTDNVLGSLPGPPASLPKLQYLSLSDNRLTSLNSPLIGGNCSLTTLDLSHNDLRRIGRSALAPIATLVRLYLRDNALSESNMDLARVFLNLTNLEVLDLSRNLLTSVGADHFAGLTSLRTLDLSHNRIRSVFFALDTPLSQVTHLNLSSNQLVSFPARAALPLTSLQIVDLSDNLLHHVTELHVPPTLFSLDLSANSLRSVPRLHQAGNLQQLTLTLNSITRVQEGDFRNLSSLRKLDLTHNTLGVMHPAALAPLQRLQSLQLAYNRLALNGSESVRLLSGLHFLRVLNLSHNRLADVKPLFQPDSLTALIDLDVSYNAIGRISQRLNRWNRTMHLERLHMEGCRLREIDSEAFSDLIYLRSVNLRDNRLSHLPLFLTHPGVKYRLRGNPITCSCHVGWLKRSVVQVQGQAVSTHDYDVSTCRTLPRGHLRPVRDVRRRDFLCVISSPRCPPNCTCYSQREAGDPEVVFCAGGVTSIPTTIPSTARVLSVEGGWLGEVGEIMDEGSSLPLMVKELYLNNSGITRLSPSTFSRLRHLSLLQLDNNHLSQLPPLLLDRLRNLTSLSLRGNSLHDLPPNLLSNVRELESLDLSHNALTVLSEDTVQELSNLKSLRRLMLSGNPWRCDCENVKLFEWLRANASRASDYNAMYCDGGSRRWFVEAEEGLFDCSDDKDLPKTLMGLLFVGLPVLILAGLGAYKFRRVIAAILYSRLGVQCVRRHDSYGPRGRLYDVSVLYDHSDRKCRWWVDRILVPRLTSSSWRLRVHVPRADQALTADGASVVDSAVYSVRQSALCIVLVSKYFGAHQHTVMCYGQVLQQAQDRPRSLVLITWGELTKQTLECGVRPFLGGRQHLPVTAPFFWDRLLYLLPSPHPAHPAGRRRRSLISACRFRSLSDVSTPSDDKPATQCTDVTQHV